MSNSKGNTRTGGTGGREVDIAENNMDDKDDAATPGRVCSERFGAGE
jgi:hypothetical protein